MPMSISQCCGMPRPSHPGSASGPTQEQATQGSSQSKKREAGDGRIERGGPHQRQNRTMPSSRSSIEPIAEQDQR
ncbi:hypothetical protein K505DRAFT_320504 [Melanomma pulvis-pyrius CBS 109.77]|uniref:Uncharacterized protein n=1 Tax=Melanomma pulvis-pyrius CBS 109.77 TaxID=1314802 RepID=A0A6A6XWL4_9PLEO|nr:hypothetical protein K505DRAFT_320504 [Melanomma pulvis-pyrius CBS 109.77]